MRTLQKLILFYGFVLLFLFLAVFFVSLESPTGRLTTGSGFVSAYVIEQCSKTFVNGWSLFSICSNETNTSFQNILGAAYTGTRFILRWNATLQAFQVWSPLLASPSFTDFDLDEAAFVLKANTAEFITFNGTFFEDRTINLAGGYNAVAYHYTFTADVGDYLSTINGQFRFVLKWDDNQQQFLIYSPLAASPEFTTISKGQGQFILVNDTGGATLFYNKTELQT